MRKFAYYTNCVNWPQNDVHCPGGLIDMIDNAQDITRNTFVSHVDLRDLQELEEALGYEAHHTRGLTMAADWHVAYRKSKLHGHTCYFFVHSAIEHVFVKA